MNRLLRIGLALITAGLMVHVISAFASQSDRAFPGKWDIPQSNVDEKTFQWNKAAHMFENDSLYLLTRFDNGGFLVVYFFTFRTPVGQKWGVIATVTDPDGKRSFFKGEIPEEQVRFKPGSAFVQMGKCIFDGKAPVYKLHFDEGGFVADLAYKNVVPTWKPGDGTAYYTDDRKVFYDYSVVCPFSRVNGNMRYDGKNIKVEGWGFGDRAHSNLSMFRQNRIIYAIRAFPKKGRKEKIMLSMLEYIAHPSYDNLRLPTIIIMKDDKYLVASKKYDLKVSDYREDPRTGYSYPWRIDCVGADQGVSFRIRSRAKRIEEVLDVINEVPPYLRPLVKRYISRPVFYRMSGVVDGELTLDDGTKIPLDLEGYSEVTFVQKD